MTQSSNAISVPDAATLETELVPYRNAATAAIVSVEAYVQAAEYLRGIQRLRKRILEEFAPSLEEADKSIKAAKATKTAIQQIVDKLLQPLDQARSAIELSRALFERAQEQETLRLEAEARAAAEITRALQEDALEAMGFEGAVVVPEPVHVPARPALPKTPGVFGSGRWGVEVTDMTKLVKAVAEGKAPSECLLPNLPLLARMAQTSRSTFNIPGVKAVYKKHTVNKA